MDSLSHLYLADALLNVTSGDLAAVPCALLPQIDRVPAYYHRLYAHQFRQAPGLLDAAWSSLWDRARENSQEDVEEGRSGYFSRRIRHDSSRIAGYTRKFSVDSGRHLEWRRPDDRRAMALALCSHTYQDIYNNPIQAFLPYSPHASGAWSLWSRIDGLEFRWVLYQRQNIQELREELFSAPEWSVRLGSAALIEAVVRRTAAACAAEISEQIIAASCGDLSVDTRETDPRELSEALDLLRWHEDRLESLIAKYSIPTRSILTPTWAGDDGGKGDSARKTPEPLLALGE